MTTLPRLATMDFQPQLHNTYGIPPYPGTIASGSIPTNEPSPPDFSPITPKSLPAIPATTTIEQSSISSSTNVDAAAAEHNGEVHQKVIAPTQYIPQPPSQPFSSNESTDGLALRAAIAALHFQRQKAKEDIRTLQDAKKVAMENPEQFARDLAAGKLKEKRPDFGNLEDEMDDGEPKEELSIPGPQNVVRMPNINWDKYNIMGEPLDAMHEQQRRWPGSLPSQQNKGREYSVTAPYSPFYDVLDPQPGHSRNTSDGSRKDSAPMSAAGTPTTNEHPYETRRNSKH